MAETEPFVWGAGGAQMTPASIAAQRKVAEALMAQGMDASPVRHWTQGAARVAQAALGAWDNYRADKAEMANMAADKEWLSKLQRGEFSGATPPVAPAAPLDIKPNLPPVDATVPIGQSRVNDTDPSASAIAGIESGGKYDKLGPIIASGPMAGQRALGKYQVMESNVGPWTKQYLGQAMTPEQFLNSPEAQDAVFKGEFGRLSAKHGPEGAARAWFAGEGGMNNPNARDQLGTTVQAYGDKFSKALGPQVASLDPSSGVSPGVRAVSAAMPAVPAGATAQPAPVQMAQAQPNAAGGLAGVNPALLQAITSPYASDGVKKIAGLILQQQMGDKVTYQTLPDGTIIALDPHGRSAPKAVFQAPTKPTWGVIGETADGGKQYGWIDAGARARGPSAGSGIEPYNPPGSQTPATITGPDGKQLVVPQGQDPKKFREHVTTATADALSGKMTEVQANATQFANRMEDAEKNFGQVKDASEGWVGAKDATIRSLTDAPYSPIQRGMTNWAVSEKYQKFDQAKSQWITALLRKESGAAISPSEFARYDKEFFPQVGDSPTVLEQKAHARQVAIDAMKKGAGPVYKPPAAAVSAGEAPGGVDPKVWAVMTPAERALWK